MIAVLLVRGLSFSDYVAYLAFSSILVMFPSFIGAGIDSAPVRFSAEYISKNRIKPLDLYLLSGIKSIVVTSENIFLQMAIKYQYLRITYD